MGFSLAIRCGRGMARHRRRYDFPEMREPPNLRAFRIFHLAMGGFCRSEAVFINVTFLLKGSINCRIIAWRGSPRASFFSLAPVRDVVLFILNIEERKRKKKTKLHGLRYAEILPNYAFNMQMQYANSLLCIYAYTEMFSR